VIIADFTDYARDLLGLGCNGSEPGKKHIEDSENRRNWGLGVAGGPHVWRHTIAVFGVALAVAGKLVGLGCRAIVERIVKTSEWHERPHSHEDLHTHRR
jgi:hypothetical protein